MADHNKERGEDGKPRSPFDYLLNTADLAAKASSPANAGYRAKRLALFAYVRQLEALACNCVSANTQGDTDR